MSSLDFQELSELLNQWATLVGLSNDDQTLGQYYKQKDRKTLNRATELDPTGMTTYLLLRTFVQEHMQETNVSLFNLVTASPDASIKRCIKKWQRLWTALNEPHLYRSAKLFSEATLSALVSYDMHRDGADEAALNLEKLSYLAYAAHNCMDKFKHMQFSQGASAEEAPKYLTDVLCVKNPGDLLEVSHLLPNGISLVMVHRTDREAFSYFAFVIKNGETLTWVTDSPTSPHPNYHKMTRNDRHMEDRLELSYFPYQLLGISFTHSGHPEVHGLQSKDLTVYGNSVYRVASITSLDADTKLWILMMFDLIKAEYYDKNTLLDEVSYCANNIQVKTDGNQALSTHNNFQQETITFESVEDQEWERGDVKPNQWMLDFYGPQVPEQALNAEKKDIHLITHEGSELIIKQDDLEVVDPSKIGSAEEILADRKWAARHNQAKVISEIARKEYDEKREEIQQWFRDSLSLDRLLDFIMEGKCEVDQERITKETFESNVHKNIMSEPMWIKNGHPWGICGSMPEAHMPPAYEKNFYPCPINKKMATVFILFAPKTAKGLAGLLGIEVTDLPPFLQHWHRNKPYIGNPILSRIDPMNWVCKDPWSKNMRFTVRVALSKSGFNSIFRDQGLKPPKLEPRKG
ncbi:MAG: hypothetical protein F6K48_03340 [Okeania sp. SIO3H1]|nr:hypothetical protein [Okeania sp. SIO3H1]